MNYFISDLHFFCKSQIDNGGMNYDGRPFKTLEEMHERILTRWNKKVTNGDTVYILGDIGMRGRNDLLIALVAQLKGRKVLIRGNHDDISDYRFKQLFSEIYDYKELAESFSGKSYKLVLSHYPILMWNGQHKGSILLYGHTHVTKEDDYYQKCLDGMKNQFFESRDGSNVLLAINVGCMMPYMDYEPRNLRELLIAKSNQIGRTEP